VLGKLAHALALALLAMQFQVVTALFAPGLVGIRGEVIQKLHEFAGLADEKAVRSQTRQSCRCRSIRFSRTNDRACGQLSAEEGSWLRHDEVALKILPAKRR